MNSQNTIMRNVLEKSLWDCTEEEKLKRKQYLEKECVRMQYHKMKQNKRKKIAKLIKNTETRYKKENLEVRAREYRKLAIQLDKMGKGGRGLNYLSLSISYTEQLKGSDHPYVFRDRMLYEKMDYKLKQQKKRS